jgi:hypothetical protein
VHHRDGRSGRELDGEVPVRHRVQRVLRRPVEAELAGREGAVDGIAGAGERGGTERHDVHARPAVRKAAGITFQHLHPGHHVMTEGDGLGHLQMREARHDAVGLAFGEVEQREYQGVDAGAQDVDFVAQPQPNIGRHLIIARAAGMQALAGIADVGGERRLDVHVHVFERFGPHEGACLDALAHAGQPGDDGVTLVLAQDALPREHAGMGDGARDVLPIQPAIEADGGGKGLDKGVGGLVETPGPGFRDGVGHVSVRVVRIGRESAGSRRAELIDSLLDSRAGRP